MCQVMPGSQLQLHLHFVRLTITVTSTIKMQYIMTPTGWSLCKHSLAVHGCCHDVDRYLDAKYDL